MNALVPAHGPAYSYTQVRCFVACPLRYRYIYLDGWREQPRRAALWFGRAFEEAVEAHFRGENAPAALEGAWSPHRGEGLEYRRGEDWASLLRQGQVLLELLAASRRIDVQPSRLQLKLERTLAAGQRFIGYLDAIGRLDGDETVLDWKTTSMRYPEQPQGILALDPQLVCYAWLSGIRRVGLVVFLAKREPEIQFLKATIAPRQIAAWERLVEESVGRIEAGDFPAHSGIRFPFSPCPSCAHLGLCLEDRDLIERNLVRQTGGDAFDWADELAA